MSDSYLTRRLDFPTLRRAYQTGHLRPSQLAEVIFERVATCPIPHIWIYRLPEETVLAQAAQIEQRQQNGEHLPLFGLPYAIKDNIDLAGHPTTAGCPAFSYTPQQSATVVERLNAAGALLIGKTNLDQFATGLVGTRSPYGACANSVNPDFIAGGSSSGSAVAVASGLVSFALGTDTAGSGRVPAGFNNIVGLKPSKGLISTTGVVPACRSLDCVSIFSLTCEDALTVLEVAQGFDPTDPFSRRQLEAEVTSGSGPIRFGVPQPDQLEFFGNEHYRQLFAEAVAQLETMGAEKINIDFAPFRETANLLYDGPWVAERLWAIQSFLDENPTALYPVTHKIITGGQRFSAVDVYENYYQLKTLQQHIAPIWQEIDLLVVPTAGTIYTIQEVEAEPLTRNSNLGYYTNFVNLLDLCAWAIPNGFQPDGLPMGITMIAPAFQERRLAKLATAFHKQR